MKNGVFTLCLLGLGAVGVQVLAAETEPRVHESLPLDFKPVAGVEVNVEQQGDEIVAKLPGGRRYSLGSAPDIGDLGEHIKDLYLQDDFNFDGMGDVAVLDGVGYGGVNLFYRLYLWDKTKGSFAEFRETVSNPLLDMDTKTLNSSQRDGPRWYTTAYRFAKGKPYTWMETSMVGNDGDLYYAKIFNAAGKLVKKVVTATEEPGVINEKTPPAVRKIVAAKAPLYDRPDEGSKTKMYVIKGDEAELLDYVLQDGMEWFLIRFKGRRVVEKWVEGAVLFEG